MKTYHQYSKDILSGKITACHQTKLACARFEKDMIAGKFLFDEAAADRVIDFFKFIPHIKGEWSGDTLSLENWEAFIVANIFGWKKKDGTRRFRTAYLEVARKNGKTSLMAGIGLYLLIGDKEAGAEIYSAATTRDQAKVVFEICKEMVRQSPLKKHITIFKNNLSVETTASKFEPLSSDYNSLDGLNVSAALVDELHAHKTRDLYDVLDTATGARKQPLILSITTAGFDKHSICWEQNQYTHKILESVITDDTHFGIIFTIDKEDDWEDESTWIKANPNLDISVKRDDLRTKAQRAKEIPSQLNAFLRKHLNVWTESSTRWISSDKWATCGDEQINEKDLIGRLCYGGLDLSTTTDVSAFVLVFPPRQPEEPYKVLCRFWIPRNNMHERVRRDRVPYDVWSRQGWINTTEGDIIDYSFILAKISEDARQFDIRDICFDRWGSTKIIQDLQNMGFENEKNSHSSRHLIDFGQGFASMSAPTKELEKMILSKEIAHGNNPVLAWMASNAVVKLDPAGNVKIDKSSSIEKVDGVVALVMALSRAIRDSNASVYEERELTVL